MTILEHLSTNLSQHLCIALHWLGRGKGGACGPGGGGGREGRGAEGKTGMGTHSVAEAAPKGFPASPVLYNTLEQSTLAGAVYRDLSLQSLCPSKYAKLCQQSTLSA